jgi:transposase
MLRQEQRAAILELRRQKVGIRKIARTLGISRLTVKRVIRSGSHTAPAISRSEKATPYRQEILDLHATCKGNLQRVHEELQAQGADLSYPALTAFCRRHGIGTKPGKASGEYHFVPGEEIQHDTSPHRLTLAGKQRLVQTASAVLCYSRMLFFQCYPTFDRFHCKAFLTNALRYHGGACERMMIDNTHVVVLRGTGAEMVPAPEMEAFADRFGFTFSAHEKGHANRSARVERPFSFIEGNFLAGRVFESWQDLNHQARIWCDKVNASYKKHIRAKPAELYATERAHLKPLPLWIPEPYKLHHRTVDIKGYINLHTNRYSVPFDWIGHRVEVQETLEYMTITLDHRNQVKHERMIDCSNRTILKPGHKPPRGAKRKQPIQEEKIIAASYPELTGYVAALKKNGKKQVTLALRQLLRMAREYPQEPFMSAVEKAAHFGLYDLKRVEIMVIRRIATDFFRLKGDDNDW